MVHFLWLRWPQVLQHIVPCEAPAKSSAAPAPWRFRARTKKRDEAGTTFTTTTQTCCRCLNCTKLGYLVGRIWLITWGWYLISWWFYCFWRFNLGQLRSCHVSASSMLSLFTCHCDLRPLAVLFADGRYWSIISRLWGVPFAMHRNHPKNIAATLYGSGANAAVELPRKQRAWNCESRGLPRWAWRFQVNSYSETIRPGFMINIDIIAGNCVVYFQDHRLWEIDCSPETSSWVGLSLDHLWEVYACTFNQYGVSNGIGQRNMMQHEQVPKRSAKMEQFQHGLDTIWVRLGLFHRPGGSLKSVIV